MTAHSESEPSDSKFIILSDDAATFVHGEAIIEGVSPNQIVHDALKLYRAVIPEMRASDATLYLESDITDEKMRLNKSRLSRFGNALLNGLGSKDERFRVQPIHFKSRTKNRDWNGLENGE